MKMINCIENRLNILNKAAASTNPFVSSIKTMTSALFEKKAPGIKRWDILKSAYKTLTPKETAALSATLGGAGLAIGGTAVGSAALAQRLLNKD